jgi:hypothetical protein
MAAQFRGIPGAVNQIVQERVLEILAYGRVPLEYEKNIRFVMKAITWVLIIFGYILASHLVKLVFWRIMRMF